MSETYPKSAFAKRFLQNILPSSVDSTAKLLHFFELHKSNTKKIAIHVQNTNGDKKKSVNDYSADNNQSITFNR